MNRGFGADVVARPRLVLDDELLPQPFRQPLRHDARRDVRAPAGGIGHDPTHRPGRVVERRGGADPAPGQSGQTRGKTTGEIHAWDHGARLLLPAFVGANDPALAVAVPFANLRAKVRGIGALAQGRWVMRPAFEKLRDLRAIRFASRHGPRRINQPKLAETFAAAPRSFLTIPLRPFLTIPS